MSDFDSFVVFAEMRTGSNALEQSLNLFDGLTCHGEVFNPGFIGHQGQSGLLGIGLDARERDPLSLLARMKRETGLSGFRFFHDHDPRVLNAILPDPRCAKVILSRDPVEAYVSRKIAEATGQWTLTDARDRKRAQVRFDRAEFEEGLARQAAFAQRVRRALQETGQAAFAIDHTEIGDPSAINGLARFLGVDQLLEALSIRLKRQNPEPLREKVVNPEALDTVAARPEDIGSGEPVRNAAVRTWVAAALAPLLFVPIKGGPTARVEAWLAALDEVPVAALRREFSRKSVRQWKNRNKNGRAFTVVCHPVERTHRVFCRHILDTGAGAFLEIRSALRNRYDVPLPEAAPDVGWTAAAHRAAFLGFLKFAKANNGGQTSLRTDPAWSSQSALLGAIAEVLVPDAVLREADAEQELALLARRAGRISTPLPGKGPEDGPVRLSEFYDSAVESAVRDLHNRDYMAFGFRDWAAGERNAP